MPESRWKGCCKQLFVLPYKCCKGCFTKPEINVPPLPPHLHPCTRRRFGWPTAVLLTLPTRRRRVQAACYYVIAWNVCMLAIGILSVSLEQSSDVKRDLYGDYSSGESDTRSWLIDNVGYGQIGFGSAGLLAGLVIRCCSEDRRKLGLAAMIVITAVCVGYGTRLSRAPRRSTHALSHSGRRPVRLLGHPLAGMDL